MRGGGVKAYPPRSSLQTKFKGVNDTGILTGLTGPKKDYRMQLFHHENGDIEFRRLQLIGKGVIEFDNQNLPLRAWVDYHETLYPFNGYKSIPADAVQLACPRYYHLELHNILPEYKRPPKDGTFKNEFISQWGDSRGLDLARAKKPKSAWDKVIIFLGLGLIIECVLWGILIYVTH